MAQVMTAKEFGQQLNLEHLEVIRRIRRGDINAKKFGWFWTIPVTEVDRVRESDWYTRLMERRGRSSQSSAHA